MTKKRPKTTDALMRYLREEKGISIYLLSLLRISKNDSKRLISSYIECTERLRKAIPANVYSQIIRTDNSSKVVALRKFI